MALTLPALGSIQYNGVTIAGPRVHTTLSCRPVYDSSGRTNVYNIYTLNVVFVVTDDLLGVGGSGADAGTNTQELMCLLNQSGAPLVFTGLGYGGLQVNTLASNFDVLYGPKTRAISFRPIASNAVLEVHWTCEVAIAQCPTSNAFIGQQNRVLEYVYTQDFSLDTKGCQTVTTRGHLVISLNRSSASAGQPGTQATSIMYNAEQQRNAFQFQIPLGFKLVSQNYRVSEDKSRLDFVGIVSEIPGQNAFPPFVSDIEVTERIGVRRDDKNGALIAPHGTIAGWIEVSQDAPIGQAWLAAILIIKARITYIQNQNGQPFLLDVDITESLFNSQRVYFSVSFTINNLGQDGLANIVSRTGLFQPLTPGTTNWQDYLTSMLSTAWTSRGNAGIYMNPSDDVIVDYCHPSSPSLSSDYSPSPQQYNDQPIFSNSTSDTTYKDWDHRVSIVTGDNTTTHYPLPTQPPAQSGGGSLQTLYYGSGQQPSIPAANTSLPASVTQVSGQTPVFLISRGYGFRANQSVEIPSLITQILQQSGWTQIYSQIEPETQQNYFGATLYGSVWYIVFQINDPTTISTVLTGDISGLLVQTQNDPANKF